MLRILEHPTGIPRPVSIILSYPALDFNFTSWMSPANLKVLRTEQSETHIPGLVHGKDHMRHKSPLSVVDDGPAQRRTRQQSWGQAIGAKLTLSPMVEKPSASALSPSSGWTKSLPRSMSTKVTNWLSANGADGSGVVDTPSTENEESSGASDSDDETETIKDFRRDADKSLRERVKTPKAEKHFDLPPMDSPLTAVVEADVVPSGQVVKKKHKKAPIGTRLTMTSRVGYFQDRIISPSMVNISSESPD